MRLYIRLIRCTVMPGLLLPSAALAAKSGEESLKLINPSGQSAQATGQTTAAPATLHDIAGPIGVAEGPPYLLYTLIALAVVAVLAIAYWWYRRRAHAAKPQIPPSMIARDELMRAREMMTAENGLMYMERVSALLRRYIEARFRLQPTRQTTREFFRTLSRQAASHLGLSEHTAELRAVLERCDLAKFAHQSATTHHLQEMEDGVARFITSTEHDAVKAGTGGNS